MKRLTRTFLAFFLIVIPFLNGCSSIAPSRGHEGPVVETKNPGVLKRYDAFYIPDIEVYSIEGDVLNRVTQTETEALARDFRSKLIRQLDQRYTMFPQPASNVALLKIAMTDVSTNYGIFQITPGMVIPNAMRGGASIHVKVIDSVSGAEVLTFRDTRQGDRQGYLQGFGEWDGVESAFDEWAMQLKSAVAR